MRSSSPFLSSHTCEPHLKSQQPQTGHTWFFRATAISASWLALAGYTLFSIIITAPSDNLRWSEDVLAALGGIALTSGYVGGLMALYFSHTLTFKLDTVILPLLLSSVGGLFELVLNYALHREIPQDRAYIYAPLIAAALSTCITAGAALFINTKIKIKQAVDSSRRRHMELTTPGTTNTYFGWDSSVPTVAAPSLRPANASTPFLDHAQPSPSPRLHHAQPYPSDTSTYTSQHHPSAPLQPYTLQTMPIPPPLRHMSSTEIAPIEANIPEDEAQRRQLLRLLIAQEQEQRGSLATEGVSPLLTGSAGLDNMAKKPPSSTYRIDWPGSSEDEDEEDERGSLARLDSGRRRYERRAAGGTGLGEAVQTSFPPPPKKEKKAQRHFHRRSASSAEIGNRWSLGNLLGRRGRSPERAEENATVAVGQGFALMTGAGVGGEGHKRNRSSSTVNVKEQREQRERRRKEIERSSLSFASGALEGGDGGRGSVVSLNTAGVEESRGRSPGRTGFGGEA
jgi:hypothetical protein